jgi:hypothetical protein
LHGACMALRMAWRVFACWPTAPSTSSHRARPRALTAFHRAVCRRITTWDGNAAASRVRHAAIRSPTGSRRRGVWRAARRIGNPRETRSVRATWAAAGWACCR